MTQSPLIAISVGATTDPLPYARAVKAAGCRTVILRPGAKPTVLPEAVAGIVFGGGAAVHPSRFGQDFDPAIKRSVDEARDDMEWGLMKQALARGIAIMGICRGFQMINVYFGGTLCQNLKAGIWKDEHRPDKPRHAIAHTVVARSGQLQAIFGQDAFGVNSIHRQGIETLAPNLTATAFTEDGLIEGYEDASRRIVAVLWHPEELIFEHSFQRRIFENLADRARSGN